VPIVQQIDDYGDYWREVVTPDYDDFLANITDLRKAFHCAISLFHMADWLYVAHEVYINATLMYLDKNGTAQRVHDEKTFANHVRDHLPDFELIRGIANSAKHLALDRPGPHPASPSHAANTVLQSTGYGMGGYGMGPFGGTPRVMLQGPGGNDLEFSAIAKAVFEMWPAFCAANRFALK
jgi:hypothetical protein